MLTAADFLLYILGAFILVVYLIFFSSGAKYSYLFESLDEKQFPFKEVYGLGFAVMETLKYQYQSKQDKKIYAALCVLYGEKYAPYYLRVIHAQRVTIALTVAALAVPLYGVSGEILMVFILFGFSALAYYHFGSVPEKKIAKRSEEILSDFCNVVSKLALLTNAGLIMREAWADVAKTGDTAIYKEMQLAVDEMNNGVSEVDALFNFGSRCMVPEIKKFTSTIVQGMVKGNSELVMALQQQSKEVWALKKHMVKRQGEKAASKLLIPIAIMFVGILVMIIVPIFTNMGV